MALRHVLALFLGALAVVAGCTEESESEPEAVYDGPPIPWDYAPFPDLVEPADNPSTPQKVALGRVLFYDPILGRDELIACATCHSEIWGMGDGLVLSIGVDGEGPTGPGRTGPNVTTRNAQTLWNVAYREELFWDGRSTSLEAQALEPMRAELELDLDPGDAAARVRAVPEYVAMFEEAFPEEAEPVTPTTIAKALSAFQRSMVSKRSPYDRYVAGDEGALSEEAALGMERFAAAGCASCHVPPLFESNVYARRVDSDDEGRAAITERTEDLGAFRVPTLRNLRETGPYFHDGRLTKLEEAVALEAQVARERGEGVPLSEEDERLVSIFLRKALMDRSLEPDRPHEVPSGLPVPEDGFRIVR